MQAQDFEKRLAPFLARRDPSRKPGSTENLEMKIVIDSIKHLLNTPIVFVGAKPPTPVGTVVVLPDSDDDIPPPPASKSKSKSKSSTPPPGAAAADSLPPSKESGGGVSMVDASGKDDDKVRTGDDDHSDIEAIDADGDKKLGDNKTSNPAKKDEGGDDKKEEKEDVPKPAPKKKAPRTRVVGPRETVQQYISFFNKRLPLAVACEAGHLEMVKSMIAHGANPYLCSDGLLCTEVDRMKASKTGKKPLPPPTRSSSDRKSTMLSPFDITPRKGGAGGGANPLSPTSNPNSVPEGSGQYSPQGSPKEEGPPGAAEFTDNNGNINSDGNATVVLPETVIEEDPAVVRRREALWAEAEELERNTDPIEGSAPLMFSVARCYYHDAGAEVARLLLVDFLMDANARDPTLGRTPLHYCMLSEMVDILVEVGGANVNFKDAVGGQTPLHTAATMPVVNSLLAQGASKDVKDNSGDKPSLKPKPATDIPCCFGCPCAIM